MRILLARHGLSEGNEDESLYIRKGDHRIGLATPVGWQQAINAGRFLGGYYTASGTTQWPVVYLSPYLRPKETFSGMVHGMDGALPGDPKVYGDPRLVEKFFGVVSALEHGNFPVDPDVAAAIRLLSRKVYEGDPFVARHLFGDSTKDTLISVRSFLDGTFARDVAEGKDDFLFVAHGAVIQAFIMTWAHLDMGDKNKIGNPGNCDIIEISGTPKNWRITRIYDGEKGVAVQDDMLAGVRPLAFSDLPAVPDAFKIIP